MILFYGQIEGDGIISFDKQESTHMVKVLRHRCGDMIFAIDGSGTLFHCRLLEADSNGATAQIEQEEKDWGGHGEYELELAVCPTKNNERLEWLAEKATEVGVDVISPVIGERSERKIYKTDRMRRIVLSATKQSLKGKVPVVNEAVSVLEFIKNAPADALKLIAYCFEGQKLSIKEALESSSARKIIVLIGPEGDFSSKEVSEALKAGFKPVHLGESRLRTETAALYSVMAVYNKHLK